MQIYYTVHVCSHNFQVGFHKQMVREKKTTFSEREGVRCPPRPEWGAAAADDDEEEAKK